MRWSRTGRGLLAIAVAASGAWALGSLPGQAQSRGSAAAAESAKRKIAAPPGPVLAVVSIARQRIRVYGSTGLLAESPVSTGMPGHRTPTGVFSVLEKRRFHFSNIYSNAPMPYMQRLTWSGVALHAGVVPGYPASHGCIRLPHPFAVELWGLTTVGTRVVVAPDDAPVLAIEDAHLPVPRLAPLPADALDDPEQVAAGKGPELASAAGDTVTDVASGPGRARLLDPLQRVKALKPFVAQDAATKTREARLAAEAASAMAAEARRAKAALDAAEQALASARRRHEAAAKAAGAATVPGTAAERAAAALASAEADLAAAQRTAEDARQIEALRSAEADAAAAAAVVAEHARRDADAALKLSAKAEQPISIFVSRKLGKVLVRQAWVPLHEAPVTFTDPGRALGTHVYLAMTPGNPGEAMSWVSVSLPASAPEPARRDRRAEAGRDPAPAAAHETAAGALARFELPEATRRFIEDRLWAGATLIVSDHAMSGETGLYTDFIVLAR